MNKIKPTNPHPKDYKIRPWRLTLVITVILFLFVGIPFLIKDHEAWNRFHTLQKEVATIEEKSLTPAGAISMQDLDKDYRPHLTGEGALGSLGCIYVECPEAGVNWALPFTPYTEESFIKNLLKDNGYQIESNTGACYASNGDCSFSAQKKGYRLSVSTGSLKAGYNLPNHANKEWLSISIFIALRAEELGI